MHVYVGKVQNVLHLVASNLGWYIVRLKANKLLSNLISVLLNYIHKVSHKLTIFKMANSNY